MTSTITDRVYGESSSVAVKAPVIAVAVTNIAFGVGAAPVGLISVNGYTPVEGDRILLSAQTNPIENGIWNASALAWTRTGDFDGARDVVSGTLVIFTPPAGLGAFYQVTTPNPIVPGTSPINLNNLYTLTSPTSYPQTPNELAAGITPVNTAYPPFYMPRYGVIPNNPGLATANRANARALFDPATVNGLTGKFVFPNTIGVDTYYFDGPVPLRRGLGFDLQECTMNLTGTGQAADSNSGLFVTLGDFVCENGEFLINWITGPSSSSGNAIWVGARASETSYFPNIYDAAYVAAGNAAMGNISLRNLRINSTITGTGLAGASAIALVGGLQGVIIENIFVNGNGTLPIAIEYEFGFATAWGANSQSTAQSSHMNNWRISNVTVQNMDNASAGSTAINMAGAYNGIVDGLHTSGVANAFIATPGEAMYFRPWVGVDDVGAKAPKIALRNITAADVFNGGITVDGVVRRVANSGYMQHAWAAGNFTVGQTCINDTAPVKMYVCKVGGASAGSGGPTGTGTGIIDGGVTWDYVSLTANVDLIDFSLDGAAIQGRSNATAVFSGAGYASIRGLTTTGCITGLILAADCTRFDVAGADIQGCQGTGINAAFGTSLWATPRKKKGTITTSFIAGNSVGNPGAFPGISLNNAGGVDIACNRIGYEAARDGVAETTQGNAVQIDTTCTNVLCALNHVGGVVGGNFAYYNTNNTPPVTGNIVQGAGGVTSIQGLWGDGVNATVALAYTTSMTIDASLGSDFVTILLDGAGHTYNAPLNPRYGQHITVTERNASGGASGAVTWNAIFKMTAWTAAANGFSRSIRFRWNATNWVEVNRTTADIPN